MLRYAYAKYFDRSTVLVVLWPAPRSFKTQDQLIYLAVTNKMFDKDDQCVNEYVIDFTLGI